VKEQAFFDSTIKLFQDYQNKIRGKHKGYDPNLANEVRRRLFQLSFICEKVRYYEKILSTVAPVRQHIENIKIQERDDLKGSVFVDAFYFFAWRIIDIARHDTKPLPYLRGLKDRAKGVRDVRNKLIQHPEKEKEKNLTLSYEWGAETGPKLKTVRPVGQTFTFKDNGLWINAQEFKNALEKLLKKAISKDVNALD
jgi:hypothetical protein